SRFLPNPVQSAKKNSAAVSPQQAIAFAAQNVGEEIDAKKIVASSDSQNAERQQKFRVPSLNGESSVRLVWLPLNARELLLCWEIILTSHARAEMFRVLVDAQSGAIILRRSLTSYLSDATYRVFTGDSPTPFSPAYSTPNSTQPSQIGRVLVTTNAFNTNASPAGWMDDGMNETRGNNVDSHLDRNGDDAPDLPRPQGSPFRVFDFALNLSSAPSAYTNASVVQLFFLSNWYHDKLYELGFTEAAGNFQETNFDRGGVGGDPVQADAQDGGGFNNANFSTAGDGSQSRMQMFIFTGPDPNRDGCLDAEVVFHELTHGVSNRRVGGGVGLYTLQSTGMGEGWSDFYALSLLSEPGDDVNGNYALGGYVAYQFSGLTQNYYYGFRRYPYSTDLTKNPLTFRDIDPAQAGSHEGIPINPTSGNSAAEEHNLGEVWCSALWEGRAALIAKHGFAAGNQLMLQLVTDGMNLSPPNPNFLQARDAILQADEVDNDGDNYEELWAAFAKRGMGFFAQSPTSATTDGIVESFDLPDDLLITPVALQIVSGQAGGVFSPATQTLTLTNSRTNLIEWNAGVSAAWLTLSKTNGTLAVGEIDSVTLNINAAAGLLGMGIYSENIRFTNLTSGVTQTRPLLLAISQPDPFTESFERGGNDLQNKTFTFTPDGSPSFYSVCRSPSTNFPVDPAGGNAVTLSDDSFATVTLPAGTRVKIYNTSNTVFYIGSNGYITLGSGDESPVASLLIHFNRVRISGLFDDLLPASGQVTWKQLGDRVAVTYNNVSEYNFPNTNSFQIEMFFNGTIRVTYLQIDADMGVAGLSRGMGVPAAFINSDFSHYDSCGARPQITRAFLNPMGNFALEFTTETNGVYFVQSSEATTNWTNISSVILGIGNSAVWTDETSPPQNQPARFYRVYRDQ
ncbi:MAG: M36 family metallopeptidase, partial [Verrucomicrobiota bacterium]